ncbi:uncharacterized protein FIESC28_05304 [Fusarium coffeatum]|uniref:SnoaL-like domain-containing protein n=1 Tax=Fusarium coffeatum TaxID=231269 RepID=A0A366RV93_9HYPO|nr:uncharacterized protein FIESC28_05304 [Fusarium coffeatum]RBR20340.1 hypothetical protein FIESC28_05304 [Fusarium coffeatum]
MPAPNDVRSAIENTAIQFLSAYKDVGEANDPSIINRDVTEDCKRHFLPKGVMELFGAPNGGPCDNATYEAALTRDMARSRFTKTDIANLVIDTEARKAAMTSITQIKYHNGDTHEMEHSWVLDFNEDGTKVSNVIEFCDMDTLRRMVGKVYTQEEKEKGLMESF